MSNGTDNDDMIMSFCYGSARKVAEIAEFLGVSDSSYLRNNVLDNLVQQGFLEKNKVGRASYYKTNREAVELE